MKKLFISTVVLFITFSCTTEEQTLLEKESLNLSVETNFVRYGNDLTDDGIDNFIEADQPNMPANYLFEYQPEQKKFIFSVLKNSSPVSVHPYDVISEKDGNITVKIGDELSIFIFLNSKEVNQIVNIKSGRQKIRYIYK